MKTERFIGIDYASGPDQTVYGIREPDGTWRSATAWEVFRFQSSQSVQVDSAEVRRRKGEMWSWLKEWLKQGRNALLMEVPWWFAGSCILALAGLGYSAGGPA